jgi:hypothetical protein
LLGDVVLEIYPDIKDDFLLLYDALEKYVISTIPKHIKMIENYLPVIIVGGAQSRLINFAYYDGDIYKPRDEEECGLLSLLVAVKNYPLESKQVKS